MVTQSDKSAKGLKQEYLNLVEDMRRTTVKYNAAQQALSERNADYAGAARELNNLQEEVELLRVEHTLLQTECEDLRTRLVSLEHQSSTVEYHLRLHADQLAAQNEELKKILEKKDDLLKDISNSPTHKLAHLLSTTAKRIPGSKKIVSSVKQ